MARAHASVGRRALTTGLVLTVVAVAFEGLAVPTVMPTVARELGGLGAYGWAFSAFMIANVVGIVAAGERADRGGLVSAFGAGLGLFAAGLAAAAFVPSMAFLIVARVVQGLGGGALSTVVYACVARAYAREEQPRMLAVLSTAWVVPGLVGPALSGFVTDRLGWRAVFLGLTPLMPLAGLLVLPALRHTPPARARRAAGSAVPAALLLALGMATVLLGVERRSFARLGIVAAGAVPALFGLRRLLPAGTLTVRAGLPAAVVAMGLVCWAFFGAEAVVPLLVTLRFDESATMAGLALTGATLTWTIGAWVQARLAKRSSRALVIGAGALAIAIGIAGVAAAVRASGSLADVWVAWAVAGLGMGLAHATVSLTVLEEAPESEEGTASAGMQLAGAIGVALGTGSAGALVTRGASPEQGFVMALALTGAAAVAALLVTTRLPGRRPLEHAKPHR